MNRDQHIALVWRKCIEANADEKDRYEIGPRAVRLADVLLAIQKARGGMWARHSGVFEVDQWVKDLLPMYDLRKDDLTEQSDECVAFLAKLLNDRQP